MRSRLFDDIAGPEVTRHVVEEFGFEFLVAEASALVFADDLIEKCGRQIDTVLIGRAARHHGRGIGDQCTDQLGRPRRGGDHHPRVSPSRNPNISMSQASG